MRLAITTGGGDAPGLNAVIRAVVVTALGRGWKCFGIRDGYLGLLTPDPYDGQGLIPLGRQEVRGITFLGGTILGTTNKGDPFNFPSHNALGELEEVDRSDDLVDAFTSHQLDALIAVGGDGSMIIAHQLAQKGLRVIGVPKTIDNDLEQTVVTFGFNTAVTVATECIDRLHTTAEAHDRVMVVEVMGRYAGWIALHAGLASTADAILIPEIPYDLQTVADKIHQREERGRDFSLVVVAEGAAAKGGERSVLEKEVGKLERLGGIGRKIADELAELTGKDTRSVSLSYLLRGGTPSPTDRVLALRFGGAAVRALAEGYSDIMVALDPPEVRYVPLESTVRRLKAVPLDGDTIETARGLGICLGD
ncbi:MAG: 6-phosphofructokinase [Acidimicrobiia bacterium]